MNANKMKNRISLVLMSLIPVVANCQHFRDRFIGIYQCNYESHTTHGLFFGTDLLYIDSSSIDTSNIIITDSIAWLAYEYIVHPDSTFEEIWIPNLKYGHFYSMDSLFLYDVYDSPAYRIFYAQKLYTGVNYISKVDCCISPNPVRNKILILSSMLTAGFHLQLFNTLGQSILEKSISSIQGKTEIDLPQLPDGIYFLKLESENNFFSQKILIRQ
jgi:hypothetical protein